MLSAQKLLLHPLQNRVLDSGCLIQSTKGHSHIFHRQTTYHALKNVSQSLNVTSPIGTISLFPHIHLQTSKGLKTSQSQPNREQLLPRSITEKNGIISKKKMGNTNASSINKSYMKTPKKTTFLSFLQNPT